MKVIANDSARYPDLSVTCHPVGDREDHISHPVVVIEVISPGTEREDRWRKKFDYFATPSIQQYAIIEQDARRVDLYTRRAIVGRTRLSREMRSSSSLRSGSR
jgi:Uma2 family endonuclease